MIKPGDLFITSYLYSYFVIISGPLGNIYAGYDLKSARTYFESEGALLDPLFYKKVA